MKPAILLIDLQHDFLASNSLEPAAGRIVEGARRLLTGARSCFVPVIHVWTSVDAAADRSMPHWKRSGRRACIIGTPGHASPPVLRPLSTEPVIHKTFFSAFSTGELDGVLRALKVDTLVLAGVHLHGCIRATALDAYQRGFEVWVAEDAAGSDDPLHAAVTQRYLAPRVARFTPVESCLAVMGRHRPSLNQEECPVALLPAAITDGKVILGDELESVVHVSPRANESQGWRIPVCGSGQVSRAAAAARRAWREWKATGPDVRRRMIQRLAGVLEAESALLAQAMAVEIGKPVTLARAELTRAIALSNAAALQATDPREVRCTADSSQRRRPLGVIAMVTPWNNPVAIPLGKIAPALIHGNTVLWKPAPAGSPMAVRLMQHLQDAGCPPGVVNLVCGDRTTGLDLMADEQVDAVTFTGSLAGGYFAQDICGRRHIPLQAELGGNNAAIIWSDCDQPQAAAAVADAAFAFAGQRCTANRRIVVDTRVYDEFLELLQSAVAGMACGDPLAAETRTGPLVSVEKCREIAALVERARLAGAADLPAHAAAATGAFFPPTIICCDDPTQEIVQQETFGPVLVVQRADDWDHALRLCNGVRQGLVASLFSASKDLQDGFLEHAQAGILKINRATTDANVEAPFGGWKTSGLGPPEHGTGDQEFYTRTQTVYRSVSESLMA
jgi:acyl-CoA reductase-like NAD-dependent aldehyde dehydrogenase/nicotinamidase-related amidase